MTLDALRQQEKHASETAWRMRSELGRDGYADPANRAMMSKALADLSFVS